LAEKKEKKAKEDPQTIKEPEPESLKHEVVGWSGGLDIRLNRTLKGGYPLHEKLAFDIDKMLAQVNEEHEPLVAKIQKWNRQYHGKKDEKSYPYPKCANTAIPISRSATDAILVRVMDRIFNQFKVFLVRAKKANLVDIAPQLEDAMDWWQKHQAKLKSKLMSPLLQAIKTGTGIVKIPWIRRNRTVPRYATDAEVADKTKKTFKLPKTEGYGIKDIQTQYDGPDVIGISREDFRISSESTTIEDARLVGYRTYVYRTDVETKVNQGLWYDIALEKLKVPDEFDETKQKRAKEANKELQSELKEPFEVWELWFKYDVDEDGEPDDVVITFHQPTKTILRAIYNPFFSGFRPFVAFKGFPREYEFDGEGVVEILEPLQEEIDSVHNQRLDRLTQINNPWILVSTLAGITKFTRTPGQPTFVDGDLENSIKILQEPASSFPATIQEEQMLVRYAQEAVGITPQVLGQPTAERPVARETMALIQEANKKFLYISDGNLASVGEVGWKVLEEVAQHSPKYTYYIETPEGLQEQTVQFPVTYLRDGIELELSASKEMMNQEARREVNLTIYQLLSDAGTKLWGMYQAMISGQLPQAAIPYLLRWADATQTLLERILRDFNQADAENLVPKMDTGEIQQSLQEMQMKMQQMQQQMQQMQMMQAAQCGQPGQGQPK